MDNSNSIIRTEKPFCLQDGENMIATERVHPSRIIILALFTATLIDLILLTDGLTVTLLKFHGIGESYWTAITIIEKIFIGVLAFLMINSLILESTTRYILTDRRFVNQGRIIFGLLTTEIELKNCIDTYVKQDRFERKRGFGTLTIYTNDECTLEAPNIRNIKSFNKKLLYQLLKNNINLK